MIILGIDPGTTIMGYSVISITDNQPRLIVLGSLDQRKVKDHYQKIARIFDRTLELIREYKPNAMAIESPFYGNNVQSMLKLGRAQGAAISAALHTNVEVFEYAPRKIKQSITGYGNASKEQIAKFLEQILKTLLNQDTLDATDSLAAALCHFYQLRTPVKHTSSKSWKDYVQKNQDRISKNK